MSTTGKQIAKVGGGAAAVATLVGALAAAVVQVRPVLADLALADAGRMELEEIRRHAIDQPVRYEVVGTTRGVVALSVFETGCVRVASANRMKSLPAPEHENASSGHRSPGSSSAGAIGLGAPACNAAPSGQCAIPADHPTWGWQEPAGRDSEGWLLYDLVWDHGCRLRARYNPQTGAWIYLAWLCCAHGGG